MESLKRPEMLLSTANTAGLIGITIYFYRQIEIIKTEMTKISSHVSNLAKKLNEVQQGNQQIPQLGQAIENINSNISYINHTMNETPTFDDIDNMEASLQAIVKALAAESGIDVQLPSTNVRPPTPPVSRRNRGRNQQRRGHNQRSRHDDRRDDRHAMTVGTKKMIINHHEDVTGTGM